MKKFVSLSMVVDAVQWQCTKDSFMEVCDLLDTCPDVVDYKFTVRDKNYGAISIALRDIPGILTVDPSDYIVVGGNSPARLPFIVKDYIWLSFKLSG